MNANVIQITNLWSVSLHYPSAGFNDWKTRFTRFISFSVFRSFFCFCVLHTFATPITFRSCWAQVFCGDVCNVAKLAFWSHVYTNWFLLKRFFLLEVTGRGWYMLSIDVDANLFIAQSRNGISWLEWKEKLANDERSYHREGNERKASINTLFDVDTTQPTTQHLTLE